MNSLLFIDNILLEVETFASQVKTRYLDDLDDSLILERNKSIFESIEIDIDNDRSRSQSLSSFIEIDKTFVEKAIYVTLIDF